MAYESKQGQHVTHTMYGRGLVLTDLSGGTAYGELLIRFDSGRRQWVRAAGCTDSAGRLVATSR